MYTFSIKSYESLFRWFIILINLILYTILFSIPNTIKKENILSQSVLLIHNNFFYLIILSIITYTIVYLPLSFWKKNNTIILQIIFITLFLIISLKNFQYTLQIINKYNNLFFQIPELIKLFFLIYISSYCSRKLTKKKMFGIYSN
ncbi:hypothetical protein D9V65_00880 [Buchnera aphidicola (Anoecia oenotherae)]|uniref:Uncharacterized protein n=1 Tax=Buchnera aphidicola (Anoecia oenotherae) TaxID=1241833 RepID=A0A4D6XXU7_9GAMM|nr:hypothetical protein D9V65_00880 [Buchnera aphidicola (Anoecia oenotherae)]